MDDPADVEAFPFGLDDEGCDTATARPACTRKKQSIISAVRTADPKFGAIYYPIVAVAHRAGLNGTAGIAASGRLRQTKENLLLAAQHRIEILILLRVVRFEQLRLARTAESVIARRIEPGAVLAAFDGDQAAGNEIDIRPAIFRRCIEPM